MRAGIKPAPASYSSTFWVGVGFIPTRTDRGIAANLLLESLNFGDHLVFTY